MDNSKQVECSHYVRRCQLVCPSCSKAYMCRLCHDEAEDHPLDRFSVTELICTKCNLKQEKAKECSKCGVSFGKYCCMVCSLFDDSDRGQFHCLGCKLCRLGGRDNFLHCDTCALCLPIDGFDGHKCLPEAANRPCPICLEPLHDSRERLPILPCRHMLHGSCQEQLLQKNITNCPMCGKSMVDMSKVWRALDRRVAQTLMPLAYRGICCQVLCKDCNKETITTFHIEGLKCKLCGSYNSARSGGSLLRRKTDYSRRESASRSVAYSVRATNAASTVATNHASASSLVPTNEASASSLVPTNEASASSLVPTNEASASSLVPTNEASESSLVSTNDASESSLVSTNDASASSLVPTNEASASSLVSTNDASASSLVPTNASASTSVPTNDASASTSITTNPSSASVSAASSSSAGISTIKITTRLTAKEEIHLYESVDIEELDRNDPIEMSDEERRNAIVQGIRAGFNGLISMLRPNNDGDPDDDAMIVIHSLSGEDHGSDSDWETDDGDYEQFHDAEESVYGRP